jgi:hypothetical protein
MKTKLNKQMRLIVILILITIPFSLIAGTRCAISVLNIDTHGLNYTPEQLGNLVRLELEKLDTFEVMDRYDVAYLVKKNSIDISNCYGKIGLVEVGKTINSQKMLSGSADLYGETIILSFRLVNVSDNVIEKNFVKEFLNLPNEMQSMIRLSLHEMFNRPNDPNLLTQLTKPNTYETTLNTPETDRLNLSGPRMGATLFTGEFSNILRSSKGNGGFDLFPVMYQFGYQFEAMYLNSGNFQALFEFIPMVTGIDQNIILPSVAILNGIRHNMNGWEFAVGPNFAVSQKAEGYYENNKWHIASDWKYDFPNPNSITKRADSRGNRELSTSFVVAIGKTFKSGRMNFPVNMYFIPSRDGVQIGLSLGYNAKSKRSR